jgi:anthranilate phosphoribosyltransferase
MLADLTEKLTARRDLTPAEIAAACTLLLDDTAPLAERADFLRTLHHKGETPAEIAGFVNGFLARSEPTFIRGKCLDICGTGGDKAGLFNVSTAAMFVATACGAPIVKHGNRGITSRSGGADVLEALHIRLDLDPVESLRTVGCAFLFAPRYHPAFKAIVPVRKALAEEGTPTIFNIIGPLLNPALPAYQLAGVFSEKLLPTYAEVFRFLGRSRAWVLHGFGGLDEASTLGPTHGLALEDGHIRPFTIDPAELGLPLATLEDLRGGTPEENARLIETLLTGQHRGPKRDIVALNAACALVVANVIEDLPAALEKVHAALDAGTPAATLEKLRHLSASQS